MKQLICPLLALSIFFVGCKSRCIEDSGNHIEKSSVVKNFNKIDVSGTLKIILKQDSSYAIKIAADSNVVNAIKMDVSSNELRISMKEGSYCGSDSIVVQVGIGELKELRTDGAVSLLTEGNIFADDVAFEFAGSSDVNLALNAGKVTTRMEGAGKLTLSGQAGVHNITTQGVAAVEAFNFAAGIYALDLTGSAKVNINVLNELNIKTEGSSEVYYKGNPKKVNEKKSGATRLEKVN